MIDMLMLHTNKFLLLEKESKREEKSQIKKLEDYLNMIEHMKLHKQKFHFILYDVININDIQKYTIKLDPI